MNESKQKPNDLVLEKQKSEQPLLPVSELAPFVRGPGSTVNHQLFQMTPILTIANHGIVPMPVRW